MGLKHLPRRQHVGRVTDADAKTNDATQAADDSLKVNVVEGSRYRFRAVLVAAATANSGVDFGLDLPGSTSAKWYDEAAPGTELAESDELTGNNNAATIVTGTFEADEDGEFSITWAQATSHADETKVLAGSTLEVENLD